MRRLQLRVAAVLPVALPVLRQRLRHTTDMLPHARAAGWRMLVDIVAEEQNEVRPAPRDVLPGRIAAALEVLAGGRDEGQPVKRRTRFNGCAGAADRAGMVADH